MLDRPLSPAELILDPLESLRRLRAFQGDPEAFWKLYVEALSGLTGANAAVICLRGQEGPWKTLAYHPQDGSIAPHVKIFLEVVDAAAANCAQAGIALFPRSDRIVLATTIQVDAGGTRCIFLASLPRGREHEAEAAARAALASNDQYAQYRIRRSVAETVALKARLAGILDLSALVQQQEKFLSAATTLCNELAARHGCDRVSLGWLRGGYVRLAAMSHADRFEKKMEIVRELEAAMEEACEQDSDIAFPQPELTRLVDRAHAAYAHSADAPRLASLVLRLGEAVLGVCTLERTEPAFEEQEMRALRLALDQVARRLSDLREADRWFGARLASAARKGLAKLFGHEHTWIKIAALATLAVGFVVALVPVPYRVTGTTILRADRLLHVTAPFDGYIDSTSVRPGDLVRRGQELLRLDRKELLLQEAELLAELNSHEREFAKAQADEEFAEIQIQSALYDQTMAKLNTVRQRLEQAIIRNPFERAVVVEGDLEQRRGAPVEQGTELLKVARIENIHAEIDIEESEVQNILASGRAEIALKSRPSLTQSVRVVRVHPSAHVRDKENVFTLRAELGGTIPDWFRPGMTGVAKVEAGQRTLWWIASHKAIDFLRLKLWW